jgi:hypothetical protein
MARLYHRTQGADQILRDGFRDSEDFYLTENVYRGVWFSDSPLDENDGVSGDLLVMGLLGDRG